MATITIELPDIQAARLHLEAESKGIDESDIVRNLIESAFPVNDPMKGPFYTAKELLHMPKADRDRYMQAALEDAAPLYAADLALPPHERELTWMTAIPPLEWIE